MSLRPGVGMSADAARKSACATSGLLTCYRDGDLIRGGDSADADL
jgi:hypothetical protein